MPAPILILGGSGGVCSALARRLVAARHNVHVLARDRNRLAEVSGSLGGAPFTVCDAADAAALGQAVAAIAADGAARGRRPLVERALI